MHKKICLTVLALTLLLTLCACSQPRLFTSDRLEIEVKGEGSRTLTVKLMGTAAETFTAEISGGSEEEPIYSIKSDVLKDGVETLKLSGVSAGASSFIVTYYNGDEIYAIASIMVSVDEKKKLSVSEASIVGDELYEPIIEGSPDAGEIRKGESSSKLIRLSAADTPWLLEDYDEEILSVEEIGNSDKDGAYEFMVYGISSGSGSVYLVNESEKQRMHLSFTVTNVVDDTSVSENIVLEGTEISEYNITDTEDYVEKATSIKAELQAFAPGAVIPENAEVESFSTEEDFAELECRFDDIDINYRVYTDVTLDDKLASLKEAYPQALSDTVVSVGISASLFQIEECIVALWENEGLVHELALFDMTNMNTASEITDAFISGSDL